MLRLETIGLGLAARYGYQPIETPLFEQTAVFERGIGEVTDVIEKELFRLAPRSEDGETWALRPEPTAGIVRAYVQHGMQTLPQPVKLVLVGPMFRYDRPQAGRYRQFWQFDIEAIGDPGPAVDAEIIELGSRFYRDAGVEGVAVLVNSIGDSACRPAYIEELKAYFRPHAASLPDIERDRLERNPLRLLDSKDPAMTALNAAAPRITDRLCGPCADHFRSFQDHLRALEIPFRLEPGLVRGLDYYTRTVFEVWPPEVGGQSTLGGGGRYDGLAEQLGGRPTPGVGFATGLERILLNLERQAQTKEGQATELTFLVPLGQPARLELQKLADQLRSGGCAAVLAVGERSLRAQLRQANALGARWAVIAGDQELESRSVSLRDLASGEQESVPLDGAVARMAGQSQ